MDANADNPSDDLAVKIARLVEERGWNQEEFARLSRLNRHTVRQILINPEGPHRLRNATVLGCANALGLTVNDLRTLPLDKLLARVNEASRPRDQDPLRRLFDQATLPELIGWLERHPARARALSADEVEELLAFETAGIPGALGVDGFVQRLERRRELIRKVSAVAGTEYFEVLEKLVQLMFEKVQPQRERPGS